MVKLTPNRMHMYSTPVPQLIHCAYLARLVSLWQGLLERLQDGVVIGDGGMMSEMTRRGYAVTGIWTPEVCVQHPSAGESGRPMCASSTHQQVNPDARCVRPAPISR